MEHDSSRTRRRRRGDALYSWIYARSLAFDGDLDLTNDYALCGDPFGLAIDHGAGRPSDPFYFGPALVWTPVLFVAKHVVRFAPDAEPRHVLGCAGILTRVVGWTGPVLAILALALGYRIARRWARPRVCLAAVVVVAMSSPLLAYGTTGWATSHVSSACFVALAMLAFLRLTEEPTRLHRAVVAGAALGLAALMRPNELAWGAGPALFFVAWAMKELRARRLPAAAVAAEAASGYFLGFCAVFVVQLLVWKTLYGAYWVVPPGRLYVQPWHAHPFLLLFSSRAGLLVFNPLMWLGLLGLFVYAWRTREPAFGRALVVGFVAMLWLASSPIGWAGGHSLSPRLLTNLAGPFVATTALFLERVLRFVLATRGRAKAVLALAALPLLLTTWGIGKAGAVSAVSVVPGPQLYSTGLHGSLDAIYDAVGNPANAPATLVFAARYRVHPKHFDALATDGLFVRDYRTLALHGTSDVLDFIVTPSAYVLAEPGGGGAGLHPTRDARVRFLVTLYWPWVTDVTLRVEPPSRDVELRLTVNGFFVGKRVAPVRVRAGDDVVVVRLPRGAFDSGINEVILEASDSIVVRELRFHDDLPHDTRVK